MSKIVGSIFKYILLVSMLVFLFPGTKLVFEFSTKEENIIYKIDLVTALIPMIISIITIALTLQDCDIFGISSFKFRRLRKGFNFSFIEMVLISVFLITFYSVSRLQGNIVLNLYVCAISIIYSLWFVIPEILILTRNEKFLMYLVYEINLDNYNNYGYGKDSIGYDFDKVLIYLILNKGILETYKRLCNFKDDTDSITLNHLLDLSLKYLDDFKNNQKYIFNNNDSESIRASKNNLISILDILALLNENKDINMIPIIKDSNVCLKICKAINELNYITKHLKKENDQIISRVVNLINGFFGCSYDEYNINIKYLNYSFLSKMVYISLSYKSLWFLKILTKSFIFLNSPKQEDNDYLIYSTFYLFYAYEICEKDYKSFSNKIKNFIYEDITAGNLIYFFKNWSDRIIKLINALTIDSSLGLIKNLFYFRSMEKPIFYFNFNNDSPFAFVSYPFSYDLIFNYWLDLFIRIDFYSEDDKNKIKKTFDDLSKTYDLDFARIIDKKLNNQKNEKKKEWDLFNFIKNNKKDFNENDEIKKMLSEYLNAEIEKIYAENTYKMNLVDFKKQIIEEFEKVKKSTEIFNGEFKGYKETSSDYFRILNYFGSEENQNLFIKGVDYWPESFINIEFERFNKCNKIKDFNNQKLNFNDYYSSKNFITESFKDLKNINETSFYFDTPIIWKKGSILFDLNIDKDSLEARTLSDFEIEEFIQQGFQFSDGLYKFNYREEGYTVFISKEELIKKIKKYYFVLSFKYSYKIYFNRDEIYKY